MIKSIIMLENNSFINLGYEYTRFSNDSYLESLENQYININVDFLSGDEDVFRKKYSILFSKLISSCLFLDIELSSFDTKNIYNYNKNNNISVTFRYNISK